MAGIEGLDVTELTGARPYRDPRTAFGNNTNPRPVGRSITSGIPGLDVIERTSVTPDARVADATRSRIASIGQPAAAVTPAVESGAVAASRGARVAGGIGRSAIGALPGLAGSLLAGGINSAYAGANPSIGGAPPVPANPQGADLIPNGADQAPAAVAPNFFRDTETGRNLQAVANATGLSGPLGTGIGIANTLRAGSTAARVANIGSNVGMTTALVGGANPGVIPSAQAAPLPQAGDQMPLPPGVPASNGRDTGPLGQQMAPAIDDAPAAPAAPSLDVNAIGGGQEAMARNLRASAMEPANAALRTQLDAYGAGAHNPDGMGGMTGIAAGAGAHGNMRGAPTNQDQYDRDRAQYLTEQALKQGGRYAGGQIAAIQQGAQVQAGEREAGVKEQGETQRNIASNTMSLAREKLGNAVTMRGQDIGAASHAATNKSALDIAGIHSGDARYTADKNADSRVSAAENRQPRYMHVAGGQEVQDIGGLPQLVRRPDTVIDTQTGLPVAQPNAAPAWASDPKVMAIKNDPKMSDADKRKQLQALGYK
jgi:hypothetical protein